MTTNSSSIKNFNISDTVRSQSSSQLNIKLFPFVPRTCTVSNLKPSSYYDVYYNGKLRNDTAVQTGAIWDPKGKQLKSDKNGKVTFIFYPALAENVNITTSGIGGIFTQTYAKTSIDNFQRSVIELRGPDNVPVTPPTPSPTPIPVNDVVWSTTKPNVPADVTTVVDIGDPVAKEISRVSVDRTETTYGTGPGKTPLSEVSLYFDYIQSFYLDAASVGGSQSVSLSDVELYFKNKPHRTNNLSHIEAPGVFIYICEMNQGIPDLTRVYAESKVRVDYDSIDGSLDASLPTFFQFKSPLTLRTGKSYGIVINFEDPQYTLWTAVQGALSIDTGVACDSAYTAGKLFRSSNYLEIDRDPRTRDEMFKPLNDTDLKFAVSVLEFDTTSKTIEMINDDYEFIEFNNLVANSQIYAGGFIIGETLYQDFGNSSANVFFYKDGTLSVVKGEPGNTYDDNALQFKVVGTNTKFRTDFNLGNYILITDGTAGNSNIRKVEQILSDTELRIDVPTTFTNSAARCKSPVVATLETVIGNPNTFILNNSSATPSSFFIDNGINYVTFTAGAGYANSDYIEFTGGTVKGKANLTTNSIGHISSINITNTGYGFTSSPPPTVTVYTSAGTIRSGSATITAYPGAQIKGIISQSKAEIANVTTFPINAFIPDFHFDAKGGSILDKQIDFASYDSTSASYTISQANYIPIYNDSLEIKNYNAEILSKSIEILNSASLSSAISEGKSSVISFSIKTDNKYESPEIRQSLASIYAFNNVINNDATDENTMSGNAASRHISKKITFAKDRYAEDIRLITNLWKPLGTDVKFYARVYNSKDSDAFDDKDWTELEVKDVTSTNKKTYSSLSDKSDYVELTYGFRQYPEYTTVTTSSQIISLANASINNTTVNGTGTTFNSSIANGDLIVFYDPGFANTTYAVAVVANTPTATAFEINRAINNTSVAAAQLSIGVVSKKYTAFNNIQNDNVVRYYSTSMTEFDTYDTMAIKIVPLSSSSYIAPRVNDIRVIGVSA